VKLVLADTHKFIKFTELYWLSKCFFQRVFNELLRTWSGMLKKSCGKQERYIQGFGGEG
jgi:hypothetical protein